MFHTPQSLNVAEKEGKLLIIPPATLPVNQSIKSVYLPRVKIHN